MKLRVLSLFSSMYINVIVWLSLKCISLQYHLWVSPVRKSNGVTKLNICDIYLAWGLKFDVNPLKRSCYAACNSIFSYRDGLSELVLLNLQEAYSLSVLMYASPDLALQYKQINELNASWNNVTRIIFGYHWWESVKAGIYGLGRLNIAYEIIVRKLKFYKRLYFKYGFPHDVFWAALLSDRSDDWEVFFPFAYSDW